MVVIVFFAKNQTNTNRNKHLIITSKRPLGVIITCLLRCLFYWGPWEEDNAVWPTQDFPTEFCDGVVINF